MASTNSSAVRQPQRVVSEASAGRNTSWPVAVLAASNPTTSPRRFSNQREATVAASTAAVMPVPRPTTTPHSNTSCHTCCMNIEAKMPLMITASAKVTTRRMPK